MELDALGRFRQFAEIVSFQKEEEFSSKPGRAESVLRQLIISAEKVLSGAQLYDEDDKERALKDFEESRVYELVINNQGEIESIPHPDWPKDGPQPGVTS